MNLKEIKVTQADPKPKFRYGHHVVIIAKCASLGVHQLIMEKKSALRNQEQYKDVVIDTYKSYEQRKLYSNLMLLKQTA